MAKYIDADRLRAEINKRMTGNCEIAEKCVLTRTYEFFSNRASEDNDILAIIDSLQQEQPNEVLIPKWCLENIENTLRIQHNINNDAKDSETCQDRNIKESLNCVRKLLNGEEITGRERSESLMKQPEMDLEKEIANMEFMGVNDRDIWMVARHFFELGQRDAANKFDELEYSRQRAEEEMFDKTLDEAASEIVNESIDTNDTTIVKYQKLMECLVKAGAKWMAGQGSTKDGVVIEDNSFIKFYDGTYIDLCPNMATKAFDFRNGDKVIVQIRKKEESK